MKNNVEQMREWMDLMTESNLWGSSGTEAGIIKLISNFYGGSTITLKPNGEDRWTIHNKKGEIKGTEVVKKGRRYRFQDR